MTESQGSDVGPGPAPSAAAGGAELSAASARFKPFRPLVWWLCLVAVGLVLYYALFGKPHAPVLTPGLPATSSAAALPVLFTLPDFSLIERNGGNITLASLAGKIWIADFIFTHCTGPCPLITRKMAGLQAALAGEPDIRLLTITVDPQRDTPERLREYAQEFGADSQRWLFLTGSREAIFKLSTDGFKLAAMAEPEQMKRTDAPALHSTKLVLIDRQGRIRGYYDGTSDEDVERLTVDARRLQKEGS